MCEKKILDVTCGSRTIWFNKITPPQFMQTNELKNCMLFGNRETASPRDLALLPPIFNAILRIFRLMPIRLLLLSGIRPIFVGLERTHGWLKSMADSTITGQKCSKTVSKSVCVYLNPMAY